MKFCNSYWIHFCLIQRNKKIAVKPIIVSKIVKIIFMKNCNILCTIINPFAGICFTYISAQKKVFRFWKKSNMLISTQIEILLVFYEIYLTNVFYLIISLIQHLNIHILFRDRNICTCVILVDFCSTHNAYDWSNCLCPKLFSVWNDRVEAYFCNVWLTRFIAPLHY